MRAAQKRCGNAGRHAERPGLADCLWVGPLAGARDLLDGALLPDAGRGLAWQLPCMRQRHRQAGGRAYWRHALPGGYAVQQHQRWGRAGHEQSAKINPQLGSCLLAHVMMSQVAPLAERRESQLHARRMRQCCLLSVQCSPLHPMISSCNLYYINTVGRLLALELPKAAKAHLFTVTTPATHGARGLHDASVSFELDCPTIGPTLCGGAR